MNDLKGKRLLIVGGVNNLDDLIILAHRNGVFVGVTDYNKDTYLKELADAAYQVNALDIDAIVELCKTEKFDGVISNFVDMLLPYVTEIANKLGYNVPYTVDQLRLSTDKKYFKKKCLEYGVSVPKEYIIEDINSISSEQFNFPVIVKPVDGSGSKGISVCNTIEELIIGYNNALDNSISKNVIVEDYIKGDEINVTYIVQDGNVQLAAVHDRYFNTSQDVTVPVPDMYIYPSRYTGLCLNKYDSEIKNMIRGEGITNGSLFMQACVKDNIVYFYEAGMRLNGCKTYQILEVENNFNTLEYLMSYALGGSFGNNEQLSPNFKNWYATVNVLGIPGETISRFEGIEELLSYPWIISIARLYHEGDKIPEKAKGTLLQDTTRIHIVAGSKEQLIDRINIVNNLYKIYNENGENIVLTPHDTIELYNALDYDLNN